MLKKNFSNKNRSNTGYQIALCGCLLAFAILLGYIEFLIPFSFGIPGVKLGLANLAVVLCFYMFGDKQAFIICILRILISSFLFGNVSSLLYSLSGGMTAFIVMMLVKRISFLGVASVSMFGAISHNIAQLMVAFLIVKVNVIFYYIPFLILFGALTGCLNGILAKIILERIKKRKNEGE